MFILAGKPFIPLDDYIDINTFLSFKSMIAHLYALNRKNANSSWEAGGYNTYEDFKKFSGETKSLYHIYHEQIPTESPEIQKHVADLSNGSQWRKGEDLATYMALMYGVSPIYVMHLTNGNENKLEWNDFVTDEYIAFKKWIDTLPFTSIINIDIFYKPADVAPSIHRDFNFYPNDEPEPVPAELNYNALLLRWNLGDGFCIYDIDEHDNVIAEYDTAGCYSLTFDHRNFHGKLWDNLPVWFYIKIEGQFTPEFKKQVGL